MHYVFYSTFQSRFPHSGKPKETEKQHLIASSYESNNLGCWLWNSTRSRSAQWQIWRVPASDWSTQATATYWQCTTYYPLDAGSARAGSHWQSYYCGKSIHSSSWCKTCYTQFTVHVAIMFYFKVSIICFRPECYYLHLHSRSLLSGFQTNSVNHHLFERWAEEWPQVQLVCDGTTSNEVGKQTADMPVPSCCISWGPQYL